MEKLQRNGHKSQRANFIFKHKIHVGQTNATLDNSSNMTVITSITDKKEKNKDIRYTTLLVVLHIKS